jgi:hypothetical protein
MCEPYLDYQKVNMNEELMIIGQCNQCCDNVVVNSFHFSIFKEWNIGSKIKWVECISNKTSNKK